MHGGIQVLPHTPYQGHSLWSRLWFMILPFFHQTPNARISRNDISMQFWVTVMNTVKCQLRSDFLPWVGVAERSQLITRSISPSSWALPCSCVSPHDQFKVMEGEQKWCTQLLGPTHENLSWRSSGLFPPLSGCSSLGNHMCKMARPQEEELGPLMPTGRKALYTKNIWTSHKWEINLKHVKMLRIKAISVRQEVSTNPVGKP